MSKKINNHFVSVGLAENFRVKDQNLWKLNCRTGEITNRHTSPGKLFMGKRLWSTELENAFMTMENKILPLIKEVITAPYSDLSNDQNAVIIPLSEKYLSIFSYILQTLMFQRANTSTSKGQDEEVLFKALSSDMNLPVETVFFIRYNSRKFKEMPLLLVDNCFSVIPTPPRRDEKREYAIVYLLPISPYSCLVWGSQSQANYILYKFPTPDLMNKNKILQEEKICEVACSSVEYLEKLKKELPNLQYMPNSIQVRSRRNF